MREELDKKLCEDFPLLFRQRNLPMTETCMCWGFDCGDGWEPLIRRACQKIEAINRAHPDYPIEASQIKEKYGTLRFYTGSYLTEVENELDAAINEAEKESAVTCEQCGAPGKLGGKGWLSTSCDACRS